MNKKAIFKKNGFLRKASVCVLVGVMGLGSTFAFLPYMSSSYVYGADSSQDLDYAKVMKELLEIYKKVDNGEIQGIDTETIRQAIEAIKKAENFWNEHSEDLKDLIKAFPELDEEKIIEAYKEATRQLVDEILNSGKLDDVNQMIKNLNEAHENMEKILKMLDELSEIAKKMPDVYKKIVEAGNHIFDNSIISNESIRAMEDLLKAYDQVHHVSGDNGNYGPAGTIHAEGRWVRANNGRWWFNYQTGGYASNQFVNINGKVYYFNKSGWMETGWVYYDRNWYYMDGSGAMTFGWQKVSNKWYFMYRDGHMAHDEYIGSYYVNKSGAWSSSHWVKSQNGRWWYHYKEGGYPKSCFVNIGGATYHFDKNGWMDTGWIYVNGKWYYMAQGGAMTFGWQMVNNRWYYMYEDGHMASNTSIGGYYVNKSGAWTTSHWVKASDGRWWYSYKEGGYPKSCFANIGGAKYHFDKSGWMDTGWVYDGGDWYYMSGSGAMTYGWQKVHGKWYYMYEDGKMAKNTVVNGYRLNSSGAWV